MTERKARKATANQRGAIYASLRSGHLTADEVGDVETLTVGQASALLDLVDERKQRGRLGFKPEGSNG